MYYYQHHIGDYRRDTAHLSLLEHGIYRQLLDLYYISEKPLDANAMRLICARTAEEMQAAKVILDEFFEFVDGVYRHKRCDAEIHAYHAKSEKATNSAKARWNKNKDLQDANALPTQSERNANGMLTNNHKPLTNNQEPNINTARGSRLPTDWVAPQQFIDYCEKERPDLDANFVADQFKDYWISVTGKSATKADWFATWRNWVRRQEQSKSKFKNKSSLISDSQFDDWLEGRI
jgi:uncharacterized protein YdaU (DUF1376 family)